MDTAKLKKMIELVRDSGIAELEICEGNEKIRITNNKEQFIYSPINNPQQYNPQFAQQGALINNGGNGANNGSTNCGAPALPEANNAKMIKSPMVGTFYRSTAPGAKPLAEIGQKIKKGDVLCIIEAMKLMNEIEAECEGTIKEVLANNEQPVEFGEPLFLLA